MKDASFNNIFDIIEVLAGAYIIYAGIRMKTSGTISSQLVGRDIDLLSARDPQGFIKVMFPLDIICGTIFVVLGLVSIYLDNSMNEPLWLNLTITGILLVTCIIFAVFTRINQDKYLK